jgi:hypothetical protein
VPARARGTSRVGTGAAAAPLSGDDSSGAAARVGSKTSVSLVGAWEVGGAQQLQLESPAASRDGGPTASSSGNGSGALSKSDYGKFVQFFR